MNLLKKIQVHKKQYGTSGTVVRIFHFAFRQIGFVWETFYYMEKVLTSGILEVKNNTYNVFITIEQPKLIRNIRV